MKRLPHITIFLFVLLLVGAPITKVSAQTTVPVTVTIYRLVQIDDPDSGKIGSAAGDFFSKVQINSFPFETSSTVSIDPDFGEGVIITLPVTFEPFWSFTRNVDPSLGTTTITIQIWDEDNPGFPLFDDHDKVDINPTSGKKELTLTLDLNTGNWTGDVPQNQGFAQGGGDSDKAKIFFDISILSADGDADGDGLLDGWETLGLDDDGDGTIDLDLPSFGADPMHKDLFLELDWMAGNAPTRVQIQAMKAAFANAPIDAGTNASAITGGVDAKNNPDGSLGINLWVDTGNLTDATGALVGDNLGGGNQMAATAIPALDSTFYAAKSANFNANRSLVFRYGISAAPGFEDGSAAGNSCFDGVDNGGGDEDGDGTVDFDGNDPDCWPWGGGWGEIGGNDFIEYNDGGIAFRSGGTIMHEFGHTLNLDHGGNVGANCKPNYVSVMNYDHQLLGIRQAGGNSILDFSPPRFAGGRGNAPLNPLVENNLNEATILDNSDAVNRFVFSQYTATGSEDGVALNTCGDGIDNDGDGQTDAADLACYQKVQNQLNQRADWNGDGDTNDPALGNTLSANIDLSGNINIFTVTAPPGAPTAPIFRPSRCTANTATNSTLTGFDDWSSISLQFRQFGDSADGAINPVTEPEIGLPELLDLEQALNTTDVEITKDDSADPAVAGEDLIYTLTVTNNGPNPASDVEVVDTLPLGVAYQSDNSGCVESPAGTLTCDLGELLAGESRQVAITVLVDADLVFNAGGPTTIVNNASVENLAGPDTDPSNNGAAEATLVVAVADLEIVSFEAVDPPAEVLVGEDVDITLRKVITNNGPSAPMDVELTKMASAPSDSSVTPGVVVDQELALGLDEQREVFETFTINCGQASHHTFSFTNEIQPLNQEDTDPDQSNNFATVDLDVECVVPVVINIKPGSDPNSINPNSGGKIPVAVLTTSAGEQGTPLDFDATLIDPLSVRFGPRDEVWAENSGAFEAHNKGHIEDAYELDESTMDGDLDMLLHFTARDTGIIESDVEACVKGEWIDVNGNVHKFFGCDAINTV